jgi:drug/metabolite transporter (DMT)-like permease
MFNRKIFHDTIFLALVACFLWSTAFAGIKIGLAYTTPLQFAGIRFILSGFMILPFCKNLVQEWKKVVRNFRRVMLISLFQTTLLYIFFYSGMNKTPAAVGAIVVGGGPLFIALMAHFITGKDPLTKRKIFALCIGLAGIVLLALSKDSSINNYGSLLVGIFYLIVGNFAGGFGNILVSQDRRGISPVFLAAVQIFIGGLTILIFSFFIEGFEFGYKPATYYFSLAWLSLLSAAAFAIWFVVLSRPEVKVSEINVWKFIIPVLGAVLSWIMIPGEKPMWNTTAGMLLIASAIVIIYGKQWFGSKHGSPIA